jgi:hypothetical protein
VTENPKKAYGATKPGTSATSPVAVIVETFAAELGARKYGPYNWRSMPIDAMTYLDAIDRHKILWQLGEDDDPDTLVSHLGNIRACCAILIDAAATGNLIDNRPKSTAAIAEVKRLFALKRGAVASRGGHPTRREVWTTTMRWVWSRSLLTRLRSAFVSSRDSRS